MEKDSRKDPKTDPHAVLAKVLVDQVRHRYIPLVILHQVLFVCFWVPVFPVQTICLILFDSSVLLSVTADKEMYLNLRWTANW